MRTVTIWTTEAVEVEATHVVGVWALTWNQNAQEPNITHVPTGSTVPLAAFLPRNDIPTQPGSRAYAQRRAVELLGSRHPDIGSHLTLGCPPAADSNDFSLLHAAVTEVGKLLKKELAKGTRT